MNSNSIPNLDIDLVSEVDNSLLCRFQCPNESLTSFLRDYSIKYHNAGVGNTTVIINKDDNQIIGYFTLKCSSIKINDCEMSEIPKVVPAVEISRFAIANKYVRQGWGATLFAFVLDRITDIKSSWVGCQIVVLFALSEVVGFYEKFGFEQLDNTMAVFKCIDNEKCICMYAMVNGFEHD